MHRSSRRIALLLALPLAGSIASCSDEPSAPPPVSVTISPASATVIVGKTHSFSVAVLNASNTAVQFSVSTPSVASIDANGILRGLALGTTEVVARSVADPTKSDTAQVTIVPVPIASLVVTPSTASVVAGASTQS